VKKIFALAVSAMALGLLVGCEDKQAELQQNSRIDAVSSEVLKLRNDLEEVKMQNQQLAGKINLVTAWLSKKVEEERSKAAAKAATPSTATPGVEKEKNGTAKTTGKPVTATPAAGVKTGATASATKTDAAKKKTNP
jgi:TolA-binding protein